MFRYLEHTSDLFIEGIGDTFEEALEEVARGMFQEMKGSKDTIKIPFIVKGETEKDLIVNFLSHILVLCETENIRPFDVSIVGRDGNIIRGVLKGEKGIPENPIKAVTYHMLKISREKGKVKIRVLFDI